MHTLFRTYIVAEDRNIFDAHMRNVFAAEDGQTCEIRLTRKDGTEVYAQLESIGVHDVTGSPLCRTSVSDISERKHAEEERKKLQAQLLEAQKMQAIGTLAGGIAHNFNNLLMTILGYTSVMLMKTEKTHPFYENFRIIEKEVENGAEFTRQLLGFARGGKYHVRPINVNDLIIKTSDMFGMTKKEIAIHKQLGDDLNATEADREQIEQVLMTLYLNAWQAMPSGGSLYLETQNGTLDKEYCLPYGIDPVAYIRITVADTGVGMDADTQKRIFEPFFTTKEAGEGAGLGLASVYGIVRNHGGSIGVYSEKGHGSKFSIYLPASARGNAEKKSVEGQVFAGSETLLLVDDEPTNIAAVKELLEEFGYKILTAQSGKKAVELYAGHPGEIQLVILDMVMPEMSGKETLVRLMEIDKNVRVLLASGYSVDGEAAEILDMGCKDFIQKPFRPVELSRKIRDILDRSNS